MATFTAVVPQLLQWQKARVVTFAMLRPRIRPYNPLFGPAFGFEGFTMDARWLQVHRSTRRVAYVVCSMLAISSVTSGDEPNRATYPQVSEAACPIKVVSIAGKAGNEVTAVVRQPPGDGPFPAIILLHGGLVPYRLEVLKEESRARPNYTRFLAAGFVIVVPTFRSRQEDPQSRDALDDCLAVVDYVKKLPTVDPDSVAVLGGSGGGSLALELAGEADLCGIVAGEPATVLFTGMMKRGVDRYGAMLQDMMRDPKKYYTPELQHFTQAKVKQIHCPVLIVHGDVHPLRNLNRDIIVPELKAAGKAAEYTEYAGMPHGFWWGAYYGLIGQEVFDEAMRFLKPTLKTQPIALHESLITRVPAGRERGEKAAGQQGGKKAGKRSGKSS